MRRAVRVGLLLLALAGRPTGTRAQDPPVPPMAAPRSDSLPNPPPTFAADTAQHVTVVSTGPTGAVARRSAWRIGAAIIVLTLTTLLLYNVRSR